jgi:photosystem II stability/assembly factor-like uncharacterized protein
LLLFHITFISSLAFGQWDIISPAVNSMSHSYQDICFVNKDTGFVVGGVQSLPIILRTVDGGNSWDTTRTDLIGADPDGSPYSVFFVNDSIGYVACLVQLFKTIDYGETWFEIDTANVYNNSSAAPDIFFINKDTGYVGWADGGSGCLRTYDGGLSWTQDDSLVGVRHFNSSDYFVSVNLGYWGLLNMQTMKWSVYTSPMMNQYSFKHTVNLNGKIVIAGSVMGASVQGVYASSTDMGVNWDLRIAPGYFRDMKFINDTIGHLSGFYNGSIRTTDGGDTWYYTEIDNFLTGMSKSLTDISFVNDTLGYGISNDGIYKTTNGGGTSQGQVNFWDFDLGTSDAELNISIYPNPATDILTLETNGIQINAIEIYSLFGQLIMSKNISNNQTIDLSDLSAGVYIVAIHTEHGTFKKRLVKR